MREYHAPAPLVKAVVLGQPQSSDLHEYRYNPGQPRDAAGRWTKGESSQAAKHAHEAAKQHRTNHPGSTTPEPPSDNHAPDPHHSVRSSLKAHLRLAAAHTAFALGKKEAAAHHLSRAEHHFGQAGKDHQAGERVARDMDRLKAALKPGRGKTRRYALDTAGEGAEAQRPAEVVNGRLLQAAASHLKAGKAENVRKALRHLSYKHLTDEQKAEVARLLKAK